MKLAKLSLVAVLALGSSVFAADTLADAFKDGKVNGVIQAYYWQRDKGTDADILNFGLDLSYETAKYNGFGFKATLQTSSSPFADKDAKTVFNGDMWASGAQLSESYLSYTNDKTTAKIGRMYMATPLVYGSGSRMNREAFEGMMITNTNLPDTTLTVAYVQKMQTRTDGNGNFGKFSKTFAWYDVNDGAYTAVLENSSIKNLNITLAYLNAVDLVEVAYAEAVYKIGMIGLGAQYYYSEQDGHDDTNLFGIKADVSFNGATIYASYTKANDAGYVISGLGNGADYAYTSSPILSDSYVANTKAYQIGAKYAIMKNTNVGANYTVTDDDINKYSYLGFTADYSFTGALKGLNAAVLFDDQGKDGDDKELRLNITYAF